MRSSGATKFGLPFSVVTRTKSTMACFAGPSFHDGRALPDVAVCACAEAVSRSPEEAGSTANADRSVRRSIPKEEIVGFMSHLPRYAIRLVIRRRSPELLHGLFNREGAWPLTRRKLNEAREMLPNDPLRGNDHEGVLDEPSDA